MTRREALSRVGLLMGGTIIGTQFLVSGCRPAGVAVSQLFEKSTLALLNEMAEVIIPKTNTPGAKDANVGLFIATAVRDCYTPENQEIFIIGITSFKKQVKQKHGLDFMALNKQQRIEAMTEIDAEMQNHSSKTGPNAPNHYYRMMKELTLLGYFTSEAGCTQALRYLPVPGKFDGDYLYKKGDKAWALS